LLVLQSTDHGRLNERKAEREEGSKKRGKRCGGITTEVALIVGPLAEC
jgi:hypothetical protein